jgi:hypothetical protein
MEIKLKFPDSIYVKDRAGYDRFFEALQLMTNRMANSHEKYQGELTMEETVEFLDEIKSALKRVTMYQKTPFIGEVWDGAPTYRGKGMDLVLGTGNTENLLDAANMLVIEFCYPKHPKARFKAQSASESPGMEVLP